MNQLFESNGSNRDTERLGINVLGGGIRIGYVSEINGDEGKEVPEFVATVHELRQLAQYWELERLEQNFEWFVYQTSGSSEWRWSVYTERRLDRLTAILGVDVMKEVYADAVKIFRERYKLNDEDWRIFTSGTQEEQDAWRRGD
jgi:hypothetical protein